MKRMTILIVALISIISFPVMGNASTLTTGTLGFDWNTTGNIPVRSVGSQDAYYEYDHRYTHVYANDSYNNEQYRGPSIPYFYEYYKPATYDPGPTLNNSTGSAEASSSASSEWQVSSSGSTTNITNFTSASGHIQSQAVAIKKPENKQDRAENYSKFSGFTFSFTTNSTQTDDWKVTLNLGLDTVIGHVDDSGPLTSFSGFAEYSVYQYLYLYNDAGEVFSQSTYPLRDFRHSATNSVDDTFDFHINPFSTDFDYLNELDDDFNPTSGRFTLNFRAYSSAYEEGNPVPVPGAIWLLGSGLIGLVGVRRKLKK